MLDQLAGQYLAEVAGLGPLLDPQHISQTLRSIYKYNYKRGLYQHESTERIYALNDEAALVICDYTRGKRPEIPFKFFSEVMTGFEYAAAALMISYGMVAEGVEVVENVRRRYDGERRNPWDEAECGHHYARAMASWAPMLALSGFRYSAVSKDLTFVPRLARDPFRTFWSTATAWGMSSQTRSKDGIGTTIQVLEGDLTLKRVQLRNDPAWKAPQFRALLGSRIIRPTVAVNHPTVLLSFDPEIRITAPGQLTISVASRRVERK
jgi:hypothetical protein